MTAKITRAALLGSVTFAAATLLPGAAAAQSTCTSPSAGNINCVTGANTVATGTFTGTAAVTGTPNAGLQFTGTTANTITLAPGTGTNNTIANSVAGGNTITTTGVLNLAAGTVNFSSTAGEGLEINAAGIGSSATPSTVGSISATTDSALLINSTGNVFLTTGNLSATGDDVVVVNAGANNVTLTTGTITGGVGGATDGVQINSTGVVNLTTGAITTADADGSGVEVFSGAGGNAVTVTTGAINTSGAFASEGVGIFNATGPVSVTTGAITTTGTGSGNDGVTVVGSTGTVTVTANGNIATAGAASEGIEVLGGTNVTLNFGGIATTGAGSEAIFVQNTGTVSLNQATGTTLSTDDPNTDVVVLTGGTNVTGTLRNVTALGATSRGLNINITGALGTGTAAPATFTTGNISATGDAVLVTANGANASLGTVTSTGGRGIVWTNTGTAPVRLSSGLVTAADDGVVITSTGDVNYSVAGVTITGNPANAPGVTINTPGVVTFTNTGTIATGTGAGSTGILIGNVTPVGAGSAITCGTVTVGGAATSAVRVNAAGNLTVNCNGAVTASGAGSDAIVVNNSAGTTSVTTAAVTANGAGSRGVVVNGAGATTVTTNGAVATNGNSIVASAATGATTVTANGNVTSTTGTGITVTSPTVATAIIGPGATVQGAVAGVALNGTTSNVLTVNGTLRNVTAGNTPYTVAGGPLTLTIGNGGTIIGPLTFTAGNDTFNLAGNYSLPAGTTDFLAGTDVLNLQPTGNLFAVNGTSTLANLETFNTSGLIDLRDGAANDVLNIGTAAAPTAYNASGGARLGVDVVGTPAGTLTADLLNLTGPVTGTTAVVYNFTGTPVVNPTGVTVVNSIAALPANAFILDPVTQVGQGFITFGLRQNANSVVLFSGVSGGVGQALLASGRGRDLWYQSADSISDALAGRYLGEGGVEGVGFWAQVYGSKDRYGDRARTETLFGGTVTINDRLETERTGIQAGVDSAFGGVLIGATAGWERASSDSDAGSRLVAKGYNLGGYAKFGGETGLFGGLLAKHDRYDVKTRVLFPGQLTGEVSPNGSSTGVEGSIGVRGGFGGMILEGEGGLAWVHTKLDDFSLGNVAFDNESFSSLRGRLGARLILDGALRPFFGAKILHEFSGGNSAVLSSGAVSAELDSPGLGTWGRFEAGILGAAARGVMLNGWVDVGDVRGVGLRAGLRFGGGRREVMPEPAAAPAPAPAPATQTCPDGSVILATDQCPPPPAPPAPAPQPGERG